MLAIARALMSNPKLLVLDEPSLGPSPTMVETTFQLIADIRRRGVTVLLTKVIEPLSDVIPGGPPPDRGPHAP